MARREHSRAGSPGKHGHHVDVRDTSNRKIGKIMTAKIINRLALVRMLQEIRDRFDPEPDAPEDCVLMTEAESEAAAKNIARMFPELVKK